MTTGAPQPPEPEFLINPNELLVAIRHLPMVINMLSDSVLFGIEAKELDRDAGLDLGLIELLRPERRDSASVIQASFLEPPGEGRDGINYDVDKVVTKLREVFKDRNRGWAPIIGKNRLMSNVEGANGRVIIIDDGTKPDRIDSDNVWKPRQSGPGQGVRVAMADTPLAPNPWLSGGWVSRYSDRLWAQRPNWRQGHGTFVAGLILSQAPGATIEAHGVLDYRGSATAWDVSKRIVEIGRTGVDILNLSFACYTKDGEAPLAMASAIDALGPEIVVVAAAGNHGTPIQPTEEVAGREVEISSLPAWPAALHRVVAVGAADEYGKRAPFSPVAPWVDVMARGEDVISTYLDGDVALDDDPEGPQEHYRGFARWKGTSFAAALISGAIAAGTQPGRISARQSWENIREQTALPRQQRVSLTSGGSGTLPDSPFVRLNLL